MNWGEAAALIAAFGAVIAAGIAGRSAKQAQASQNATNEKIAKADDENNAGRLALEIALRTDARLNILEGWRDETVNEWWPRHELRDRAIEAELRKLDATTRIPEPLPLPPLRRQPKP